jgi:hypothetical protein
MRHEAYMDDQTGFRGGPAVKPDPARADQTLHVRPGQFRQVPRQKHVEPRPRIALGGDRGQVGHAYALFARLSLHSMNRLTGTMSIEMNCEVGM